MKQFNTLFFIFYRLFRIRRVRKEFLSKTLKILIALICTVNFGCGLNIEIDRMEGKNKHFPDPASNGSGSIFINLSDIDSKTLLPSIDMNTASYDITGSGPDGATFAENTANSPVQIDNLVFGDWTVSVNAKNSSDNVIGTGQGITTVHGGQTSNLNIVIKPVTGTGTLVLNVAWDGSKTEDPSIDSTLFISQGSSVPCEFIISGGNSGTCTLDAIPTGYHTLVIKLLDNGETVIGAVEDLRIVKDETTSGLYNFNVINELGGSIIINLISEMDDPIDVTMSGQVPEIGTNQSLTLNSSVPGDTGDVYYSWNINGSLESEDQDLTVSGLSAGVYRIDLIVFTVDYRQSGSASFMLTVIDHVDPVELVLSPSESTEIVEGDSLQYSAIAIYENDLTADVTTAADWISSNELAATIGINTGLAVGVSEGTTEITASFDGVTSDASMLIVNELVVLPVSIEISPEASTIDADGTQQYTAIVEFDDGSSADMTGSVAWSSSSVSTATINQNGLASGVTAGITNILAAYEGIASNAATLTVEDPLRIIDISPNSATIAADQTIQFSAAGIYASGAQNDITGIVTWNSSDNSVATINSSGLVSCIKEGTIIITAEYNGIISDEAIITVYDPLRSLSISTEDGYIDLSVNPITEQFTAIGTYASGDVADITDSVEWSSSNSSVAAIDSAGLATGIAGGTTYISAEIDGIISDSIVLTVIDPPVTLVISPPDPVSIVLSETLNYTATVAYASDLTKDVTIDAVWSSSDSSVANIDVYGVVTSTAIGTTEISASYTEGSVTIVSNISQLSVTNNPVLVEITPDPATIPGDQDTLQFTAIATLQDSSTVDVTATSTWNSSDNSVATIDANGLASRVSASGGAANITAEYGSITSGPVILTVEETPVDVPVVSNIDLHRRDNASYTEMELWDDWNSNSGSVIPFDTATTAYYAYIGGFDQITLVINASGATTFTINGTDYAANDIYTHTVTFTAQGENIINVQAGNAGGVSPVYTITVNFLNNYNWWYGVYWPYMRNTIEEKWYSINQERDNGDELTISGNVAGEIYWKISNSYNIECDEVVSDEAAEYFGEDGSRYCGSCGLFNSFNRISVISPYNDGNATYSGAPPEPEGKPWSANWHGPANEGGLTFEGDSVGRITNVISKQGNLRGRLDYYMDGILIGRIYQHYVIDAGDIVEDSDSYTDVVYMPGTTWEETVRYTYAPSTPSPL